MRLGVLTFYFKTPNCVGSKQDRQGKGLTTTAIFTLQCRKISAGQRSPNSTDPLPYALPTISSQQAVFLADLTGFSSCKILIARAAFFSRRVGARWWDTTSLPQHHQHTYTAYLRKMAPGAPRCPVLAQSSAAQEGGWHGPAQVPWGCPCSTAGDSTSPTWELPRRCLYINAFSSCFIQHKRYERVHLPRIFEETWREGEQKSTTCRQFLTLARNISNSSFRATREPSTSRLRSLKESKRW